MDGQFSNGSTGAWPYGGQGVCCGLAAKILAFSRLPVHMQCICSAITPDNPSYFYFDCDLARIPTDSLVQHELFINATVVKTSLGH